MKTIFVINVHSAVDVITNSSTELFVCEERWAPEIVKETLKKIIENASEEEDYFGSDFDSMFAEPRYYTEEEYKEYMREISITTLLHGPSEGRWYDYGYERKENIGRVIIEGAGDNTIPVELFDKIEEAFSAERYHLG